MHCVTPSPLDKIKRFLTDFYSEGEGDDGKVFTYAEQLTNIAHRDQVELTVDLEDVAEVRTAAPIPMLCMTSSSSFLLNWWRKSFDMGEGTINL